jgi:hypothetical protein
MTSEDVCSIGSKSAKKPLPFTTRKSVENILDAQRMIERIREAGTNSVVGSTDGGLGRTCSGRYRSEA